MKRLNNSGMTLVEMILSILILGIISVAFAASFLTLKSLKIFDLESS